VRESINSAEVYEDDSSRGETPKNFVNVAQFLNMTSKEANSIPFDRKIIGESIDSNYNETALTKGY
jgi:hypothetical protein